MHDRKIMNIRARFPILSEKVYLNSCSKGALSVDVKDAYQAYLRDWQEQGSPWELWVGKLEATRQAFAALVNASAEEVAVTTSVSAAVSTLASALDFRGRRNKVVVTDFAFPTTAQIWHAQEQRGAQVVHVAAAGNEIPLERLAEAIDEETLLVSISHVCYRNGVKQDVPSIVKLARQQGALLLLDSYQTLGTMPVDVHKLGVDFLVGGALKYLLGSSGLAFLYARHELIPQLSPSLTGWFAQADIFAMDIYHHRPAPAARRFETGTPSIPNLYAALAGIDLIRALGVEKIEARIQELTAAIKAEARRCGYELVSPADPNRHGALITVRSHDVELLVTRLAEEDIITSSRDGNLRISPHAYNDEQDVSRLMECLAQQRDLLF